MSIRNGFGKGSLVGCRASRPVWRLVCRPRLVRVGSARMVVWHLFLSSLFRDAIYLLWSEKRSRFSTPASVGCVRSPAAWVGVRRRSLVSCAATLLLVAEAWSIGPRPRSGIRIGAPAARRFPNWPRTTPCVSMCKIVSAVLSPAPTASWYQALRCVGWVVVMGPERIVGGRHRGAPSRSRTGSGSISPIMSPCESLTRRSTRRYMCKAGVRSNGNWWRVCAPGERCGCRGHGPASGARASSAPRS